MKRILIRAGLALLVVVCVVYAGDAAVLHFRMAGNAAGTGPAFDTVTFYLAADLKNQEYEVFTGTPQQETCVHEIFPHYGFSPCWYSSRRTIRTVS